MFTITGTILSPGNETPHFLAWLNHNGERIARMESDGNGGSARVRWLTEDSLLAGRASAWLVEEAKKVWERECPGRPFSKWCCEPSETAIMAVPAHLMGMPELTEDPHRVADIAIKLLDAPIATDAPLVLVMHKSRDPQLQAKLQGTIEFPDDMNPRFVCWVKSRGAQPSDFGRDEHGDVTLLDGAPWTMHFMLWIQAQWREWAAELGFTQPGKGGRTAHEEAQLSMGIAEAHRHFDAWLRTKVGA